MFTHNPDLSPEYNKYIRSRLWKRQRKEALIFHGNICLGCHTDKELHVHHLRYGHFTDLTVNDLLPLCKRCHESTHNSYILNNELSVCKTIIEEKITIIKYLNNKFGILFSFSEAQSSLERFIKQKQEASSVRNKKNFSIRNFYCNLKTPQIRSPKPKDKWLIKQNEALKLIKHRNPEINNHYDKLGI